MANGGTTKKAIIWSLLIGVAVGVGAIAATTEMVHSTSTVQFCVNACHSMQWVYEAYERGPHSKTKAGVTAGCGDCHIPYESRHASPFQYVVLMTHKAKAGIHDAINEAKGTISTKEKWEKERPRLSAGVKEFMASNNSLTCRGCHDLAKMANKENPGVVEMHADVLKQPQIVCIECHENVGHVYDTVAEAGSAKSGAAGAPAPK